MATIIDFRPSAARTTATATTRSAPAEIVIFPGIRYERWDAEPVQEARSRNKRKRDLLELCE